MIVRLNGRLVEDGPLIDTRDRGLLLGDGAFETIYVEGGRPAFLGRHAERLNAGLASLRIPARLAADDLAAAAQDLAAANALVGKAVLRITVTRGPGARGLAFDPTAQPTELFTLSPLRPREGIRLFLSDRRLYSRSSARAFKPVSGYLENMLALNEARGAGADEALMLNEFGRVASAAAANVFVAGEDGVVATPPPSEGALAGIIRGLLLESARTCGVVVEERPVELDEVRSSAVFLTNSLIGVASAAFGAPGHSPSLARLRTWYEKTLAEELGGGRS